MSRDHDEGIKDWINRGTPRFITLYIKVWRTWRTRWSIDNVFLVEQASITHITGVQKQLAKIGLDDITEKKPLPTSWHWLQVMRLIFMIITSIQTIICIFVCWSSWNSFESIITMIWRKKLHCASSEQTTHDWRSEVRSFFGRVWRFSSWQLQLLIFVIAENDSNKLFLTWKWRQK